MKKLRSLGKKAKVPSTSKRRYTILFSAVIAIAGVLLLSWISAAPAIVVDATLPVPKNVKIFSNDDTLTVTWDGVNNSRVVGYYITYKVKGASDSTIKVRQTQALKGTYGERPGAIQLQPLLNGTEYEVTVQSAAGTWVNYKNGNNAYQSDNTSSYARGDGKVSNKVTISGTPSSARVDAQRQRLTGFFDDFDSPAGPFDELKWNQATTACVAPGTAAAFVNDQFHSHNMIRSECDRSGMASRPRATFDMSNVTETNPGQIEFDLDGTSQPRDTWYLDIIPLSARKNNMPLDLTAHNDLFDSDSEGPGNMVRLNARYDTVAFSYYKPDYSPSQLGSASPAWADMSTKVSSFSPLAEPSIAPITIPNVRRHWVVQITPTKIKLFIDSSLIMTVNTPAQFFAEKKFTIHSTIFSYNTGKQYLGAGSSQDPMVGPPTFGVSPYVQLIHWDNFGFNGPAPSEVVHNYMEGSSSGTQPVYSTGGATYEVPEGPRTTIIPIPDDIGNLVNGKARLYFTQQNFSARNGYWSANDYVMVNGKKYSIPDPATVAAKSRSPLTEPYVSFSQTMLIDQADLVKGNNTIRLNVTGGSGNNATAPGIINVHLELPYAVGSSIPSYTSPQQIFGQKFLDIIKPPITTCDQYIFVESDLGLPYESGKGNLVVGPCTMIDGHNITSTTPGTQLPANSSPSVSVSSSTTNTTSPASYSVVATATDNDGTIAKIEIKQGSTVAQTCTNTTSCTYNASSVSKGSYAYSATATDNIGAATTSNTVNITVSDPTTPPASGKFTILPVNATLPSESECASRVRPTAEVRPGNAVPNSTRGVGGNYMDSRITGNYTGTTDEIIQWASCKWGMDEDVLRAQMAQESYWHQSAIGDFSTDANACSPVYPIKTYPPQYGGDATHTNQCPESVGLSQVRWTYHKSAFYSSTSETAANLTNNAIYSTAYNVDYYASRWRNCYNGNESWLNQFERGKDYAAGDQWGCVGLWFAGRWYTDAANGYITNVQNNLNGRVWETAGFKSSQPVNTIPGNTAPQDTTPPTVTLTAPTNGATISGTVSISATASDNVAVTRVSYFLDGSSTAFSNDSSAPYTSTWSSTTVSNGNHTIKATAVDAAGNVGTSATITVNVQNTVVDTTKPTASITAPANNATVKDTILITATATDNVGVTKLELLVDGQLSATDTTSPYSFSLNTANLSEGTHTFQVRAYDAANNMTASSTVSVTVDNIPAPQPTCQDPTANNIGQPLPCTYNNQPPTPKTGDVNGDNMVNIFDLSIVISNWLRASPTRAQGDVNGDGSVNIFDLSIIISNWLK